MGIMDIRGWERKNIRGKERGIREMGRGGHKGDGEGGLRGK